MNRTEKSPTPLMAALEARVLFTTHPPSDTAAKEAATQITQTVAGLSEPRSAIDATVAGALVLLAGGYSIPSSGDGLITESDAIDLLDTRTGAGRAVKLPTAGHAISSVSFGQMTLLAGGFVSPTATELAYLFDSNTWTFSALPNEPRIRSYDVAAGAGHFGLIAGGEVKPSRTVDIYDFNARTWSTSAAPYKFENAVGYNAGVGMGNEAVFVTGSYGQVFSATTRRWKAARLRTPLKMVSATTVGTKALFIDDGGHTAIYDSLTGRWRQGVAPFARSYVAATHVGSTAFFAGGNTTPVDTVNIYDAVTDSWSSATLSAPRFNIAATSLGRSAFFAGGIGPATTFSGSIDVLTLPGNGQLLSGGVAGSVAHRDKVEVFNTGDADLAGPYTIQLYASSDRTLSGAILVGSLNVTQKLAMNSSASFNIRSVIPMGTPAGTYHLLAAVQDLSGQITPIAAEDATFKIRATAPKPAPAARRALTIEVKP